jgi:DUF917 family protein
MCEGAVLRSDGGDYPLACAIEEIERIDREHPIAIELVDVDEMDENLYAVTVGKLGPVSTDAAVCHDARDGIIALRKMQEIMEKQGKKIGYLYTLEHDCIQLPYFLKVATMAGLPLLNADSCGRSVPTLGNILTCVYHHPISPLVYASIYGESVVIETPDPCDTATMERIGRSIVVAYNNILIAYCLPPLSKAECQECLVAGSPASLQETGRALLRARAAGTDPAEEVLKVLEGKLFCRGAVASREWVCRDGFDFGKTVIQGDDGHTYTLLVQNENLALQDENGTLLLTAPDSIGMIRLDRGEGVTNDELTDGMRLAIIGIKAAEPWYRIPEGFTCWDEVFHNVGLDGVEHVPF